MSARSVPNKSRENGGGRGRKDVFSMENQLLMALVCLHLGWLELDLSYEFGISMVAVSRIMINWINFLYL